jgi:D-alanyl-D-alanine carboxypeptidase
MRTAQSGDEEAIMKRLVILTILGFIGLGFAQEGGDATGSFDDILDRTIDMGVPGAVLYIDRPDRGTWIGARGVSNLATGRNLSTDDRFRTFSIAKMVTAVVILQLAEEGTLDLDDPIGRWLDPDVTAGIPQADAITVRQLVDQRSGIYDYFDDRFAEQLPQDPSRAWSPEELVAWAATNGAPYAAPNGELAYYSNTNYVLLGLIIERATGTALAEAIRARIFDPLGMTDSFSFEEGTAGDPISAYLPVNDTLIDVATLDLSIAWAAGGLISTVEDLGVFTRALFEGELFADPATLEAMTTFAPLAGRPVEYGMGVTRFALLDPAPLGHSGEGPGMGTVAAYWPGSGDVVVIAVNLQSEANFAILVAVAEQLAADRGR